jgi:peptidoglycan pentaglycine glycine transferase (the first glycine)
MELRFSLNREEYTAFVQSRQHTPFTQSWEWGELCENEGMQVFRFGVEDEGRLIMTASVVLKHLFLGRTYLYVPRGPVWEENVSKEKWEECLKVFLSGARDICYQTANTQELFIRIEPNIMFDTRIRFIHTADIQPSREYATDLTIPEENFLAGCHKKLIYNSRLAEKKGVKIERVNDIQKLWHLLNLTAERHSIKTHSLSHYMQMSSMQTRDCATELWCAYYNNIPIAGVVSVVYGDTAYYVHGGSDHAYRQMMAPDLLHMELIKLYRSRGIRYYNFGGVAPMEDSNHPLTGVTIFKKKFSGEEIVWPGTFDYVYDTFFYKMYIILRRFRRLF